MREIRTRVLAALVALVLAGILPAIAAGPPRTGVLSDGTRFEIAGDQLLLTDRSGRKTVARDGAYKTTDGVTLVVTNGRLAPVVGKVPGNPKSPDVPLKSSELPLGGAGGGSSGPSSKSGAFAVKPITPDLKVTGPTVSTSPSGWQGFPYLFLTWKIENLGAADSNGTILRLACQGIVGPCPDEFRGDQPVPPLPAKSGAVFTIKRGTFDPAYKWVGNKVEKATQPRRFTVSATVDPDKKIGEQIEGNNTVTYTYQWNPSDPVPAPATPQAGLSTAPGPNQPKESAAAGDLSGKSSFPTPPNPDLVPELEPGKSFTAGQQVWLIVRNKGDLSAGPSIVRVVCQGSIQQQVFNHPCAQMGLAQGGPVPNNTVSSFPVPGIPAGSFQPVTLLKPPANVTIQLEIEANPGHAIAEKSYTNNKLNLTAGP